MSWPAKCNFLCFILILSIFILITFSFEFTLWIIICCASNNKNNCSFHSRTSKSHSEPLSLPILSSHHLIDLITWQARDKTNTGHSCKRYHFTMILYALHQWVEVKLSPFSRDRPEGSLFNSYYTEVYGRVLLLPLDCFILPLIRTL